MDPKATADDDDLTSDMTARSSWAVLAPRVRASTNVKTLHMKATAIGKRRELACFT